MQSYLWCRGGMPCLTYLYSHTHKKLYQVICIINNVSERILFTEVRKKWNDFRFLTKNGTPIHIAAPSQHKHKIKHDKTTMQSYLWCRGGMPCLTYLYSHTHKKLYQVICIINNVSERILFTEVRKKWNDFRFLTKNGTPIHIAAPSQHKHKIKHDKTTMQSSCYAGEAYSLAYIYSHTYK